MKVVNIKEINLDVRQEQHTCVCFFQNDTNIINFITCENGSECSLSGINQIVANYKRPDGEIISRMLDVPESSNTITYQLGLVEMAVPGYGKLTLQLYGDNERLSTYIINVHIKETIEANFDYKELAPDMLTQLFAADASLNRKINDVDTEFKNELSNIVTQINTLDAEHQTKIDNVVTQIESLDAEHKAELNSITERIDALNAEYTTKFNDINSRIDTIISRLDSVEAELTQFLRLTGGEMSGDIEFEKELGPVVRSPLGVKYRLGVNAIGSVTADVTI